MVWVVDLLMEEEVIERFLGQIREIELLLRRIVMRRVGVHFLKDQNHIRMGIVFHCLGLRVVVRMRL